MHGMTSFWLSHDNFKRWLLVSSRRMSDNITERLWFDYVVPINDFSRWIFIFFVLDTYNIFFSTFSHN